MACSWYYSQPTGDVSQLCGWEKWSMDREIQLQQAAAKAGVPQNMFGPFATQAQAEQAKQQNPSWPDQAAKTVQGPVTDVTSAITAFANQVYKLTIRLAEAAVGIVLLAIAANVILKQTTGVDVARTTVRGVKKAGQTAGKVAAVVPK